MALIIPTRLVENNVDFGRTINQLMDSFVNKELEKRKIREFKATIVEIYDNKPPTIYINKEAQFIITLKTKRPTQEYTDSIAVNPKEVANIKWYNKVLNKDSAKFLIIRWDKDNWILDFDFRYNIGIAKIKLDRAREFMDAVKKLNITNNIHPIIYLLWSAYELTIDAKLFLIPKWRPNNLHSDRKKKLKILEDSSDTFSQDFSSIFGVLSENKNHARYALVCKTSLDETFVNKALEVLEREIQAVGLCN